MLDIKNKIFSNKQHQQVIILYAATLIGLLLGVINSIINTRFLDPIDYGNVRYVQNIINFLGTILLFGYFVSGSRLLALSQSEQRSRQIRGCLIEILAICILITIVFLILIYCLHDYFKPFPAKYLFLVSIPVCGMPLMLNYINTTAQGDNQIGRIAVARCVPAVLYSIFSLIIYNKIGATSSRMILLQWGISTVVLTIVILSTRPSFKHTADVFVDLRNENRSYGFQLYLGSLAMVATQYLAGISLGLFNLDNSYVGFYTLALTVTSPLQTLPAIIGTTYFKKFTTEKEMPHKVFKFTVLMTFASCLIFIILIYPLVKFLYTEKYASVGIYAAMLSIGFSFHGLGDMINRFLGSHGRGKEIRNSSFICGFILVLGNTVLVFFIGIYGAIATKVVSSLAYSLSMFYYYKKFIKTETIR